MVCHLDLYPKQEVENRLHIMTTTARRLTQIIHIGKKNEYEITEDLRLNFLVDTALAVSRLITVIPRQRIYHLFTYYAVNGC